MDISNERGVETLTSLSEIIDAIVKQKSKYTDEARYNESVHNLVNFIDKVSAQLREIAGGYHMSYESQFDEAWAMAHTLRKIDAETHDCAMCGGRADCGYSYEQFHKNICQIMYGTEGYHNSDKYKVNKKS